MSIKIEELVLMTLSFFEPMTLSHIILDFDNDLLLNYPDLDKDQLLQIITTLEKKKCIKQVKIDKEIGWIRVHPKRSWWKKLFPM